MTKRWIFAGLAVTIWLEAGAYKIPEQSLNSMALGAAYVARTTGADSAYFNPANMAFLDPTLHYAEGALGVVYLPSNRFEGTQNISGFGAVPASGGSKHEWAAYPMFHYVHSALGRWRWGVSLTTPDGLTKRWSTPVQKLYAQKFRLMTLELNPSVSYRLTPTLALGAGVRLVYSEGEVYSDGNAAGIPIKREMQGDTVAAGYNLALAWHPTPEWQVGITYRSKIDLKERGRANLYLGGVGHQYSADVTVPMPAALNIAVAHTFAERLSVELVYERTYWSAYKNLDFHYDTPIAPALVPYFDDPKPKNWQDTNTWRLGLSYRWNDRLTLMAGYSYDETPIPDSTLSYELPDSDADIFTLGFRYRQNRRLEWGAALLYDRKRKRSVSQPAGIDGRFKDGGAILMSVGFAYRF